MPALPGVYNSLPDNLQPPALRLRQHRHAGLRELAAHVVPLEMCQLEIDFLLAIRRPATLIEIDTATAAGINAPFDQLLRNSSMFNHLAQRHNRAGANESRQGVNRRVYLYG